MDTKRPNHYKLKLKGNDIEVRDIIDAVLDSGYYPVKEGAYLYNVLKYVMRYKYKDGIKDLEKAKVYIDWIIDLQKGKCEKDLDEYDYLFKEELL